MRMVTAEVKAAPASRPCVDYRSTKAFGRAARPREEVESEIQAAGGGRFSFRRPQDEAGRNPGKEADSKDPFTLWVD